MAIGGSATIVGGAGGTEPIAYQWRKGSADIMGANSAALVGGGAMATDAGSYACVMTNSAGSIVSAAAVVSVAASNPANPARLVNLAVRTTAGPSAPLIVGFVVGGAGSVGK